MYHGRRRESSKIRHSVVDIYSVILVLCGRNDTVAAVFLQANEAYSDIGSGLIATFKILKRMFLSK